MGRKPFVPVVHAATIGRPDEEDTVVAAEAVAAALARLGHRTEVIGIGSDLDRIDALKRRNPLAVFNLVEAIDGDCRKQWLATARLDRKRLAYTGCDTGALRATASKLDCKRRLLAYGLPTPAWLGDGGEIAAGTPVIVKPADEHASLGIDAASVVAVGEASRLIAEREARFGTPFFAEQFIDGREFNISLIESAAGLKVLPMPEIIFEDFPAAAPRIVDYAAKWDEDSHAYHHTPRLFGIETADPRLAATLRDTVIGTWQAFGLAGYVRVDLRVDAAGNVFVIDINANPCISPDAGLAAAAEMAGIGYDELVDGIVTASLVRAERDQRSRPRRRPAASVPGASAPL